jgi:hypothetical protein
MPYSYHNFPSDVMKLHSLFYGDQQCCTADSIKIEPPFETVARDPCRYYLLLEWHPSHGCPIHLRILPLLSNVPQC